MRHLHIEVPHGKKEVALLLHEVDWVTARAFGEEDEDLVDSNIVTTVRIEPRDIPEIVAWLQKQYDAWAGDRQPDAPGQELMTHKFIGAGVSHCRECGNSIRAHPMGREQ